MRGLRRIREWSELSLDETARAAGVDKGQLSRVERGQGSLSLDAFRRVALVLELRPGEVYELVCNPDFK